MFCSRWINGFPTTLKSSSWSLRSRPLGDTESLKTAPGRVGGRLGLDAANSRHKDRFAVGDGGSLLRDRQLSGSKGALGARPARSRGKRSAETTARLIRYASVTNAIEAVGVRLHSICHHIHLISTRSSRSSANSKRSCKGCRAHRKLWRRIRALLRAISDEEC
jgi:hypothetical protein